MACLIWSFLPVPQPDPQPAPLQGEELRRAIAALTFAPGGLVRPQPKAEEARLGASLFFDQRFSANGQISCASCHQAQHQFSDARPKAIGLAPTQRRTPSLVNAFAGSWFFWDGRSDSLAAQALGPIEHPLEHGISRARVVSLLRRYYLDAYTQAFGPWPAALQGRDLPEDAMPAGRAARMPIKLAAYTMASLDRLADLDRVLVASGRLKISAAEAMARFGDMVPATPPAWQAAWEALTPDEQEAMNQVFMNFGRALAAFQEGIVALDSPFDRFAARLAATPQAPVEEAFGEGFGSKELAGLQLFVGPGRCTSCHSGPFFSDQQFHNIGLPLAAEGAEGYIDVGRAAGLVAVQQSVFNCRGPYQWGQAEQESCRELPWLDGESLELVGAFKTPSLRNVAKRPPYMHDGRFAKLAEVLAHYNDLAEEPGLGHREETLQELGFNGEQQAALEAFLESLTAPVEVLTLPIADK